MRIIEAEHLDNMALGAAVLGAGGGGNPYIRRLVAQSAIRNPQIWPGHHDRRL
jgi:DUF917 family protein